MAIKKCEICGRKFKNLKNHQNWKHKPPVVNEVNQAQIAQYDEKQARRDDKFIQQGKLEAIREMLHRIIEVIR